MGGFSTTPSDTGLNKPPTSIVNSCSAGNTHVGPFELTQTSCKAITSGTGFGAGINKNMLSLSGSGVIDICAVYSGDVSARTVGMQIVIDGVTVFNATSDSVSATGNGLLGIGTISGVTGTPSYLLSAIPTPFSSSLDVYVSASTAAAASAALLVQYRLTQ